MAATPARALPLVTALVLSLTACAENGALGASSPGPSTHDDGGVSASPPDEACNALDDDGDGSVDEGCPCTAGARQACWPGDPARRGVGLCADGEQVCAGPVEFAEWGPCAGVTLPAAEVPGNLLDEDCDGFDGDRCITPGGCATDDPPEPPPGGGDPGGDPGGGGSCASGPPAMLVVLDRTQSMHRNVQGDTPTNPLRSKWAIAIGALETVLPAFDATLDVGLELFPRESAGCVTLGTRIAGTRATNAACEAGEVVLAPTRSASASVASALDPLSTKLCNTTPIGLGLETAGATLRGVPSARRRAVLLVTDGRETCTSDPVAQAQDLASAGITTYVVAFDEPASIDERRLDNLACAGRTARALATNCVDEGGGRYVARDPGGPRLFHFVGDEVALEAALRTIAADVSCAP